MGKIKIPLEAGQKVIFSNGITGRIVEVDELRERVRISYDSIYAEVYGYGGVMIRDMSYREDKLEPFYLLGKNLIGNKVDPNEIEQDIAHYRIELDALHRTVRCLRRQLFQLITNMTDEAIKKHTLSNNSLNCVLSNESEKTDK